MQYKGIWKRQSNNFQAKPEGKIAPFLIILLKGRLSGLYFLENDLWFINSVIQNFLNTAAPNGFFMQPKGPCNRQY